MLRNASSLDLMRYYAKLKNNLEDKIKYIQKIKVERNIAQDQIRELLKISNSKNLKKYLIKARQSV